MNDQSISNPSHASERHVGAWLLLLLLSLVLTGCGQKPASSAPAGVPDPNLHARGDVEVTARLEEIPEGAIFQRELYDYATVLKYHVIQVHRGEVKGSTIYVAHYNPFKARSAAADARVKEIGGNVKEFRPGQVYHMALQVPVEDHYMGGIVNKYFGKTTDPIYWAVWTNLE